MARIMRTVSQFVFWVSPYCKKHQTWHIYQCPARTEHIIALGTAWATQALCPEVRKKLKPRDFVVQHPEILGWMVGHGILTPEQLVDNCHLARKTESVWQFLNNFLRKGWLRGFGGLHGIVLHGQSVGVRPFTDRAKAKALLELILKEFKQPWTEFDASARFQFQGVRDTLEYTIHELFREDKT